MTDGQEVDPVGALLRKGELSALVVVADTLRVVVGVRCRKIGAAHRMGCDQADVALPWRVAVVGAGVVIHLVAVITGFVACLTFCDVVALDPVAANRRDAAVSAGVGVHFVGVIAALIARLSLCQVLACDPVAAPRQAALCAGVCVLGVTVIALLIAILTFEQVLTGDPISAPSRDAQRAAGVGVERVAVVAGLVVPSSPSWRSRRITPSPQRAVVQSLRRVGVFDVAVIALFALVEAAVAAA